MASMMTRPPSEDLAYEQIEAAVKETSRGRWFLEEFARRQRNADTIAVLGAIEALQRSIQLRGVSALPAAAVQPEASDIFDLARAIAKAQAEIRSLRADTEKGRDYETASDELDAVIATTEQATSSILSAAERVQEQAWTLRETAEDPTICDHLDACATEIYTACAFQDLTAQRIRKMVDALTFIDNRLGKMLESAGLTAELETAKAAFAAQTITLKADEDIWMSEAHQAEIDETFEFFTPAAAAIEPTMVGAELLDLGNDAKGMDELLKEAGSVAEVELPKGLVAEQSFALEPEEAPIAPAKPLARTFRFETVGVGTPDHDVMLDGIVHQPDPVPATPLLDDLDKRPVEARLKAFR